MPRFKITVKEVSTTYLSKEFEAESLEAAKEAAYADNSWTDLDGWEETWTDAETDIEEADEIGGEL